MDINDFCQHFMNTSYKPFVRERKKKTKNKLSYDFDKLFFNLLIFIRYDIPMHYNKYEEKQIKYKISEQLDSFSYKKKEEVIQNLCFDDTITLKTMNCLAQFYKLNLVYFHFNVFFKMLYGDSETVYIINKNKDFYYCSNDKLDKIYSSNYEIRDIQKPLYSASHYKVKEIQEITEKMHLETDGIKKKLDLYNHIKSYLEEVLF